MQLWVFLMGVFHGNIKFCDCRLKNFSKIIQCNSLEIRLGFPKKNDKCTRQQILTRTQNLLSRHTLCFTPSALVLWHLIDCNGGWCGTRLSSPQCKTLGTSPVDSAAIIVGTCVAFTSNICSIKPRKRKRRVGEVTAIPKTPWLMTVNICGKWKQLRVLKVNSWSAC